MEVKRILFYLLGLVVLTVAEKLEKIEGTSGEFSDIVVDSKGRWYIIRAQKLHISLDGGKTLKQIELPSKESVHTGLGIDQFDNIYVQDDKLSVFVVALVGKNDFVFEEIQLAYGAEKLVSRPFALGDNKVFLASKKGLMELENSGLNAQKFRSTPSSKTYVSQFVRRNISERFGENHEVAFYSAGNVRHWVYQKQDGITEPVFQTISFVKRMFAVNDRIYCIVNGDKNVNVIHYKQAPYLPMMKMKEKTYMTAIDGIDVSNINDDTDFVIYSPRNDYKTYIYGNVGNSGVLYGLGEKLVKGKNMTEVVSTNKLENVRLLSGVIQDDRLYLGTSDGVYELTDIMPKRVIELS